MQLCDQELLTTHHSSFPSRTIHSCSGAKASHVSTKKVSLCEAPALVASLLEELRQYRPSRCKHTICSFFERFRPYPVHRIARCKMYVVAGSKAPPRPGVSHVCCASAGRRRKPSQPVSEVTARLTSLAWPTPLLTALLGTATGLCSLRETPIRFLVKGVSC